MASGEWTDHGVLTGYSCSSVSIFFAAMASALLRVQAESISWLGHGPQRPGHGGEA